jgi:hypothetical protein
MNYVMKSFVIIFGDDCLRTKLKSSRRPVTCSTGRSAASESNYVTYYFSFFLLLPCSSFLFLHSSLLFLALPSTGRSERERDVKVVSGSGFFATRAESEAKFSQLQQSVSLILFCSTGKSWKSHFNFIHADMLGFFAQFLCPLIGSSASITTSD